MMPKELYRTIIFGLFILCLFTGGILLKTKTEKELSYQKKRLTEFNDLLIEYRSLKEEINKEKKGSTGKSGLLKEIDSIIIRTGLKEKIKTLKQNPQKKETSAGILEETELDLQKITMNEFANLLYQIEGHSGLVINRLTIKRSFENQELLNISLIISSFTQKERTPQP